MPVAPATMCGRSARVPARRRATADARPAARAARSRGRSRCRAACSSGSRSVSLPVSARTSHVLPWSMWPAVPTVSGIAPGSARARCSSARSRFPRAARATGPRSARGRRRARASSRSSHLPPPGSLPSADDRLEDDQPRVGRRAGADRAQDRGRALVVPVVEDRRQEVDVALRHALEEAARDELDPVAERRLVAHGLGQVEDDSAQARLPLEQRRRAGSRCRRRRRRRSRRRASRPGRAAPLAGPCPAPSRCRRVARSSGCAASQDQKSVPWSCGRTPPCRGVEPPAAW